MADDLQVTDPPPAEPPGDDPGATLIAIGRERGHVTADQIAAAVEEVDLGADGIRELHGRIVDAGIEIVLGEDGDGEREGEAVEAPPIVAPDLTVEPGVDSLR
ncbi:MAG TPA: RNA polymerase sigma factor region1.1 domain-containing protein, partial [Solirubrobacterales bacterium]|nr:RNA polymerase sigma factor region1.1 domain-containing protein [Solirubrobacterales bacterium]